MTETVRFDTIWQDASIASNFNISRTTIPLAEVHFDIVHRLIDEVGIVPRRVLDLGAGDGLATLEVASRHPVELAVLTDFSEPMLQAAGDRRDLEQWPFRSEMIAGDFRRTDWHAAVAERGPFDLVISRYAIHHIPDPDKRALYAAIFRWLAPGGMFAHIEHVASATDLYHRAHDRLLVDRLVESRGGEADFDEVYDAYRQRADGGANILAPVADQLQWLRDIGFVDVDLAFKCFELSVFAGRRPESQKEQS